MTKMIRKTIDVHKKLPKSSKYVNIRLLDATTDSDIEKHIAEDDAAALFDAAEFAKSNKIDLTSKIVNWHKMPTTLRKDAPMPTRNVVLTDHQAMMIEELVTSGRYQNASEVLRDGSKPVNFGMKIVISNISCVCKQMKVPHCSFRIQMKSG